MASVDKITAHLNGGAPVTCLEGFGKVIAVGKAGLYGDLFDGDMDIRKKKERLFQTPLHGVVRWSLVPYPKTPLCGFGLLVLKSRPAHLS